MSRPWLVGLLLCCGACGGTSPETHYYQLALASSRVRARPASAVVLAIEPFAVNAAYDSERIIYRESPWRLDYYQYHRWSAAPARLVSEFLRQAYAQSGQFGRVELAPSLRHTVTLSGRLLALEEVDESSARWLGRVELQLELRDPSGGRVLWSGRFTDQEPLTRQEPEGLARALSTALQRIAGETAGPIASAASGAEGAAAEAAGEVSSGSPRAPGAR